jgi:hypothetical protein
LVWAFFLGDFDGDGVPALVCGNPNEAVVGNFNAGTINVFENRLVFLDGFEAGSAVEWSGVAP